MTLLELLVAFGVFVMLVAALVALATAGLDTWREGETRKDIYDRAQRILDLVRDDLRNVHADDRWIPAASGGTLQHAHFAGDLDLNKAPRLRFVRAGQRADMMTSPDMRIRPPSADLFYTDLWEVAWILGGTPEKPVLLRCVRYFDRRTSESLLNADDINNVNSAFVRQNATVVDDSVLWISFKYWSQYTTTWFEQSAWVCSDGEHAIRQQYAGAGKCQILRGSKPCGRDLSQATVFPLERAPRDTRKLIGPSPIWESSRTKVERWLFKKRLDLTTPDFVYPEIVQVTIVVESTAPDTRGAKPAEAVDDKATSMRLYSTKGMPDGPATAKIDAEWISYERKGPTELMSVKRGQRGTTAAGHAASAQVRFGETFVTDIHVPAFREAVR
jgi:type II secretory pathway pseudopilin PulG